MAPRPEEDELDTLAIDCLRAERALITTKEVTSGAAVGFDLEPPNLPVRIRDLSNPNDQRFVKANTRAPFIVDNDTCRARAILKVRTDPQDPHFKPYFDSKKRMFEVMIEAQFKNVGPDDRVYIGIEGDSRLVVSGFWANTAAAIVRKLIECTVAHAHVTLGDDAHNPCQLVFPLDTTADRLCVTPPGKTPPPMGVHMFPQQYGKSRRPQVGDYNSSDTYSFSFHSMYVDLTTWRLVNLPGISHICLDAFLRGQSLRWVCYAIPKDHVGPHTADVKRYILNFEIDNVMRKR